MRIVAIDTTGAFGSIALHEDGQTVEAIPLYSQDGFSQVLFDHLRRLLARHDWKIGEVACFAAAAGPGSFTGVRVGLTAAKGLAEATRARAFGISNLQALAQLGTGARRGVMIDARRGEIYAAVYDSELDLISPEVVMPARKWIESLNPMPDEIISTDLSPSTPILPASVRTSEHRELASAVAAIVWRKLQAGEPGDPLAIDANYVRRSDAELFWRDR